MECYKHKSSDKVSRTAGLKPPYAFRVRELRNRPATLTCPPAYTSDDGLTKTVEKIVRLESNSSQLKVIMRNSVLVNDNYFSMDVSKEFLINKFQSMAAWMNKN